MTNIIEFDNKDSVEEVDGDDLLLTFRPESGELRGITQKISDISSGMGGGTSDVADFTDLDDTPTDYDTQGGRVVAVKTDESGLEFINQTGSPGPQGPKGEPGDTGPAGQQGQQGERGLQGYQGAFVIQIFIRNASTPTRPTGGNVDVSAGTLSSHPTGWSTSIPSGNDQLWISETTFNPAVNTSDYQPTWSNPHEGGSQGPKGEKGDPGDVGPAGAKGDPGDAGAAGAKGDPGDVGPAGPVGPVGPAGAKGEKGDTGPAGADGSGTDLYTNAGFIVLEANDRLAIAGQLNDGTDETDPTTWGDFVEIPGLNHLGATIENVETLSTQLDDMTVGDHAWETVTDTDYGFWVLPADTTGDVASARTATYVQTMDAPVGGWSADTREIIVRVPQGDLSSDYRLRSTTTSGQVTTYNLRVDGFKLANDGDNTYDYVNLGQYILSHIAEIALETDANTAHTTFHGLLSGQPQLVPDGGTAGQVLAKNTGTDYDTDWVDAATGSGTGTTALVQSTVRGLRYITFVPSAQDYSDTNFDWKAQFEDTTKTIKLTGDDPTSYSAFPSGIVANDQDTFVKMVIATTTELNEIKQGGFNGISQFTKISGITIEGTDNFFAFGRAAAYAIGPGDLPRTFVLGAEVKVAEGPRGPAGVAGADGARGRKGDTGDTGPAGAKGEKGDTGDTGPAGAAGEDGDDGTLWATGTGVPTGRTEDWYIQDINNGSVLRFYENRNSSWTEIGALQRIVANPAGSDGTDLTRLTIGNTNYKLAAAGGSSEAGDPVVLHEDTTNPTHNNNTWRTITLSQAPTSGSLMEVITSRGTAGSRSSVRFLADEWLDLDAVATATNSLSGTEKALVLPIAAAGDVGVSSVSELRIVMLRKSDTEMHVLFDGADGDNQRLLVREVLSTTGARGEKGDKGDKGDTGDTGNRGARGPGVPNGGTTGQVLAKKSNTNQDTEWVNAASGGSGGGSGPQVLSWSSPPPGITNGLRVPNAINAYTDTIDVEASASDKFIVTFYVPNVTVGENQGVALLISRTVNNGTTWTHIASPYVHNTDSGNNITLPLHTNVIDTPGEDAKYRFAISIFSGSSGIGSINITSGNQVVATVQKTG